MNKEISTKIDQIKESVSSMMPSLWGRGRQVLRNGALAAIIAPVPAPTAGEFLASVDQALNGRQAHTIQVEDPHKGSEILPADEVSRGVISLEPFQALTVSAQRIRIAGVDYVVSRPDQRVTVTVAAKGNVDVDVQHGPGAYKAVFQMPADMNNFVSNTGEVLKVQGSRNDIPGNCEVQGCTGGSREVFLVGFKDFSGEDRYEPGEDRMRDFTGEQHQLPEGFEFLGAVEFGRGVAPAASQKEAPTREGFTQRAVDLKAGQVLTVSVQKANIAGIDMDENPENFPGRRLTAGILVKSDVTVVFQHGPGAFVAKFQLPNNPAAFLENADKVLRVQSSRNDLQGNCLPEGCTEGTEETLLVVHADKDGNPVYEMGRREMREFTGLQLQLPADFAYLGEVK